MSETKRQRQQREAAERWMGGRLSIPGIPADLDWDAPPPYVHECHKALRDTLELWVKGLIDIPVLRRILTDRQMHLRGRVSMAKTLLAINRLMDFRTCNLGTPIEEKNGQLHWLGRPITFIAVVAGIGYYACKDRIDDIVKHSGMSRHPQTGNDEGKPYGRPSVRHMFSDFLESLGDKVAEVVKAAQATAYRVWKEAHEVVKPSVEAAKKVGQRVAAAAAAAAAEKVKRRSPEVSALLYAFLEKMRPGYRRPNPDTS